MLAQNFECLLCHDRARSSCLGAEGIDAERYGLREVSSFSERWQLDHDGPEILGEELQHLSRKRLGRIHGDHETVTRGEPASPHRIEEKTRSCIRKILKRVEEDRHLLPVERGGRRVQKIIPAPVRQKRAVDTYIRTCLPRASEIEELCCLFLAAAWLSCKQYGSRGATGRREYLGKLLACLRDVEDASLIFIFGVGAVPADDADMCCIRRCLGVHDREGEEILAA